MKRGAAVGMVLSGLLSSALSGTAAHAQVLQLGRDENAPVNPNASPQNFALEIRGGPYYPVIDSEFDPSGPTPFLDIFGDAPRLMMGLELDWQVLRINYVGTLGIGGAIGYSSFTRPAPETVAGHSNLSRPSGQETSFNVLPMYAVAVLRLDGLAEHTPIPLVPYLKVGLGYSAWWVTSGELLARRNADSPIADPAAAAGASADLSHAAYGGSLGTHLALGMMLRLDIFEPQIQRGWDNDMGVNHSYLFFEYSRSDDGALGSGQLQLGCNTWTTGIALEM